MPAIAVESHLITPAGGIAHVQFGHAHTYYRLHGGEVRACDGTGELEQVAWWRKLPGAVESSVKRALGGSNVVGGR